jgi:(heptosyl)LPS beta-1,4-glucosyltransferase
MQPLISVVINTLNEEKNLPYALMSVKCWADQIIIVDMYSEDHTVDIAREFGAHIFFHPKMGYADPARAFAVSQASGDWILILDADELVPQPLSNKLKEISQTDKCDIVILPYTNYLLGKPLMYTGWGPYQDTHPRFFKPRYLQVTDVVHDFLTPVSGARIHKLPYQSDLSIIHFNYLDVSHFITKLNQYTTIEAKQALERNEMASPFQALYKAIRGFMGRYIKLKGYRDNWQGFYLSLFWAFYRLVVYAKMEQIKSVGARDEIEAFYRREAERYLIEYANASVSEDIHNTPKTE